VLKCLRAALRAVTETCGSNQSPYHRHPLFPAVQAAVSPVVLAHHCRELCERGCNDNLFVSAPFAGTLPTCALLYHEFTRPALPQREKQGQLAQDTGQLMQPASSAWLHACTASPGCLLYLVATLSSYPCYHENWLRIYFPGLNHELRAPCCFSIKTRWPD
jgi:hypothetical protein